MRTYLLPETGRFHKANLHAHTSISDGAMTPAEIKEHYKKQGYSILAYTDHELIVDHSDLADPDFLPITAVEYAVCEPVEYVYARTIELNLYARDPHNVKHVCFDKSTVIHGEKWRAETVELANPPCKKVFQMDFLQKVIDEANKYGFLVCLNHPAYSMVSPEEFGSFNGLFAMEIYNSCSLFGIGVDEYNPLVYDWMLRHGKMLHCIASDDTHGRNDPGEIGHCFGGWCMIKVDNLDYGAVIAALEKGNFYSSTGPEIYDLYVEDGKVTLKCSPAKMVKMATKYRNGRLAIAQPGETIAEATFTLPKNDEYMRFEVVDEAGRHANTNAYPLARL